MAAYIGLPCDIFFPSWVLVAVILNTIYINALFDANPFSSGCRIGNTGFAALAHAIACIQTLLEVDLRGVPPNGCLLPMFAHRPKIFTSGQRFDWTISFNTVHHVHGSAHYFLFFLDVCGCLCIQVEWVSLQTQPQLSCKCNFSIRSAGGVVKQSPTWCPLALYAKYVFSPTLFAFSCRQPHLHVQPWNLQDRRRQQTSDQDSSLRFVYAHRNGCDTLCLQCVCIFVQSHQSILLHFFHGHFITEITAQNGINGHISPALFGLVGLKPPLKGRIPHPVGRGPA